MKEFKVGDKVYCPMYSTSVLRVARNKTGYHSDIYPLAIAVGRNHNTLNNEGKIRNADKQPVLFHATPENHELLEKLYGVEFEKPPVKPTSKEIIQAMLERGDRYVPCWVSIWAEKPSFKNASRMIRYIEHGEITYFIDADGDGWEFATPFDPRTGESITELPT